MNDTPETDGEWNRIACYDHPQFEQGIAEFARKLERERDDLRNELNDTIRLLQTWEDDVKRIASNRDYWKAEAKRWREINK